MFPTTDWQFWTATLIFLAAAGYVLRNVIPWPWNAKRQAKRGRRATLTISGKPVK
jgi:hypothetical protein